MTDLEAARHDAIQLLSASLANDVLSLDGFEDRLVRIKQAENRATIAAITADLDGPSGATPLPVQSRAQVPSAGGETWSGLPFAPLEHFRIASIFGSTKRAGSWTVPLAIHVHVLFGEVTIDLRDAVFSADSLDVELDIRFGSFTLIVPPGVQIENEAREVMSSSTHSVRDSANADPIGLLIRLKGSAFCASVEVKERQPTPQMRGPKAFFRRLLGEGLSDRPTRY
ncbi:MAG: hypothetical protein ABI647_00605 [Gemmatimonadota bacterium]